MRSTILAFGLLLPGVVLGPFARPDGKRLIVYDDPQGAAFALRG